jgi:hypothetical protein
MSKIQPPTDVDLRLHALNLAVAQSRDKFRFSDETDQTGETLAMARRYRDWIANGDEHGDPEPGTAKDHVRTIEPNGTNFRATCSCGWADQIRVLHTDASYAWTAHVTEIEGSQFDDEVNG